MYYIYGESDYDIYGWYYIYGWYSQLPAHHSNQETQSSKLTNTTTLNHVHHKALAVFGGMLVQGGGGWGWGGGRGDGVGRWDGGAVTAHITSYSKPYKRQATQLTKQCFRLITHQEH